MALSNGAKVGIVAAVGLGAFLLAGGSSSAAGTSAKPLDPCNKTPPDCASLTACVAKLLPIATKADVPDLQKVSAVAKSLGCADLVKQLDAKIAELSKTTTTTTTGGGGTPTKIFSPTGVTDRQRLVNAAWTLARMGPHIDPIPDADRAKYHVQSNNTFRDVSDAIAYSATGRNIGDRGGDNSIIVPPPSHFVREIQNAANLTVDGIFGTQTRAAFGFGLSAGSPSKIGSEGLRHNHHVIAGVGSESVAGCSACDAKHSVGQSVEHPESFGPYNAIPNYEGAVVYDRVFGSQFGSGPANGPLARKRIFGHNARWGV